ncbi:MAG TPA: MarR family winged helix-turn-helix transcriptional regulator [Saprospiraceae bacterium]|nr:MarR family winged helix-turn-helix transcriptional regulator [Saprospiraceae bacterium]
MNQSDFNLMHQNGNTESKIVVSLERIAQAFRVLLWQESKEHALTPIQVQVLIFLHYHSDEKCKVSYLAHEFNMTKATISDTVKILENKKLIYKVFEPKDGRSYVIRLTHEGKMLAEKTAMFSKEISKPIDEMDKDEKEILLRSLLNIIRHLNQTGIITIQRMCLTCSHYQSSKTAPHYCRLLKQRLHVADLRIDCPEHIPK